MRVLPFGRSVRSDLEQLRSLREATENADPLPWRLDGVPLVPLHSHIHLVPPVDGVDEVSTDYARMWTDEYRYGAFFYRVGPGFVLVKDVRPSGEPSRMTIDQGAEEFLALASASTVGELSPQARELVDTAEEAGLLLRDGDQLLVLPYRMRHWPVPYLAV